jgi:uncharacterized delta-60 repeat protein
MSVGIQTNGALLVGGQFTSLGGQTCTNLGRLNADGTRDMTFNPEPTSTDPGSRAWSAVLQADGKILVGGTFTHLSGQTLNNFGRLLADGEPDPDFHQGIVFGPFHNLNTIALQPDDRILLGGPGNIPWEITRLNADGTLDSSFSSSISGNPVSLTCLTVQSDGKILVGGKFTTLNGQSRVNIGRLNVDGTLDTSFNPAAHGGSVESFALQADGKILVGGEFTNLAGQACANIARLNANGSLDTNFNAVANGIVLSLAIQPEGKILVGGSFTDLCRVARNRIGRLNNTALAAQSLSSDGTSITWLRGGTSPEVWRTTFEVSTNGTDWTHLGRGIRMAGGWQLAGLTLPANCTIRARGFVATGHDGNSSWFDETKLLVIPSAAPTILANFGFRTNQFRFDVSGTLGQVVVVEASTNLLKWDPLATNTVGTGPYYFRDPVSQDFLERFYRVRLLRP